MIAGGYTIQYVEDYHIPLWQFLPVQTIQNGIYTSSIKTATYGTYGDGTNTEHTSWSKEIIDVATDHNALVPIIAAHFEDI